MGASPVWWKCSKCNRKRDLAVQGLRCASAGTPEVTGRFEKRKQGWYPFVEYKCGTCGHVGWTLHLRARHMFVNRFPEIAASSGLFTDIEQRKKKTK